MITFELFTPILILVEMIPKLTYKALVMLLLISLFGFSSVVLANEEVVFNKVWTTNAKVTEQKLDNIAAVSGSGFKFVSLNATFVDSKTANNVNGTLEYTNSGVRYSISGQIAGKFTTSGNTTALYFFSGSQYYVLVVPSFESSYLAADDPSYNSSGPDVALAALKTVQANHVIASISDPTAVTESASATYVTFSLVFSKSRTASGDNVAFTPSISHNTTASSDFSTGTIEYYNTSTSTWLSASSGVTVAYNVNSLSLRIAVADDTRPEVDETFTLNTGTFTGTGSSQIDNSAGTYAMGTLSDNNDPLIWTGATNTSWSTSSNWNPNDLVPTVNFYILVPGSLINYPIVASDYSIKSLEIRSGAKVNLSNGVTLSVTGAVTNNGDVLGQGELNLNGSSAQTISGIGFYRNLKINNSTGVTITSGASNAVKLTGVLTLNSGTLTTNGNLTLKNSSTVAGIIGLVNCGSANLSGTITTERFIPGSRRSFRYLTPGVTSTTSIKSNWQEGVNNTLTGMANNNDPNPKYGTHITGSKTGLNGFDATLTGNSSLYTFDATTQNWIAASNTNVSTLKLGMGYKILVRGSRSTDMSTNTPIPDSTILRSTGTPCLCTTIYNSTGTGSASVNANTLISSTSNDFTLVGNPYWAYVNWHTISKTNVSNTYYIWDPNMRGSNDRGAFVPWIYNPSTNSGYTTAGTSAIERYIQPGQAFFIQTTGANPSLTFNESDKLSNDNGRKSIFSVSPGLQGPTDEVDSKIESNVLNVLLYIKDNLKTQPADGVKLIYGNGWSNVIGVDDAVKLTNLDENMALIRENKLLSFEGRSVIKTDESDSTMLKMWNLYPKTYTLRLDATQFYGPQQLYLVNKTAGTRIPVPLKSVTDIDFTMDASHKELSNYMLLIESVQQINASVSPEIKGLVVYPNPIIDLGNLKWDARLMTEQTATIILSDLAGHKLFTQEVDATAGSTQINISKWPKGIYFLEFSCGKKVFRKKIIKS